MAYAARPKCRVKSDAHCGDAGAPPSDYVRQRKTISEEGKVTMDRSAAFGCLALGLCFATAFCAWCQHIYTCFTNNHWGFLIAGALFFPIAIVHGLGIWFGFWH
jgi:hypothetical protein